MARQHTEISADPMKETGRRLFSAADQKGRQTTADGTATTYPRVCEATVPRENRHELWRDAAVDPLSCLDAPSLNSAQAREPVEPFLPDRNRPMGDEQSGIRRAQAGMLNKIQLHRCRWFHRRFWQIVDTSAWFCPRCRRYRI